jgi:hypothetical protein
MKRVKFKPGPKAPPVFIAGQFLAHKRALSELARLRRLGPGGWHGIDRTYAEQVADAVHVIGFTRRVLCDQIRESRGLLKKVRLRDWVLWLDADGELQVESRRDGGAADASANGGPTDAHTP